MLNDIWPGPVALILPAKDMGFVNVHPEGTHVFRCPASKEFIQVCDQFGPLYGTSVNISGETELKTIDDIKRVFPNTSILYDGTIPRGYPSTIVSWNDDKWKLVRNNDDDLFFFV